MNWAFCGFGNIAKKFCTALLSVPDQKIVAVATRSQTAEVQKWAGSCKVYEDYKALAEDPKVDIVYINTTHNFHVEQIILFASHGKHILCEKPVFIHPSQIKLVKGYVGKVFIMEALWTRFLPAYQFVKKIILEDRIGTLKWADINFAFDNSDQPKQRLHTLELAGGALLDIGIYPVQLVLDLMDHNYPDTIDALATLNDEKVDISTAVTMHFKENDFYGQIFCSVDRQGNNQAVIYGKKGSITMKLFWMCYEVVTIIDGVEKIYHFPHQINGYEYQIYEVVNCIKNGKLESEKMSFDHSVKIIEVLGSVKSKIGYGM